MTYIDLGAVDNEQKAVNGVSHVIGSEAPSRARQLVAANDILVSTVRPYLNGVATVPSTLDGATASTGFCVLRANPDKIHAPYLFQWVQSPAFIDDMIRKSSGASYPAVSDKIIGNSRIPLPPLPEQRRIAAILDQADALRRLRRQSLTRLADLGRAHLNDLIGNLRTNERQWPIYKLGDICRPKQWKTIPTSDLTVKGFPVYGANGKIGFYSSYNHETPTVLITCRGATCGTINICEPKSYVTGNAMALDDLRDDLISTDFLSELLKITDMNQVISGSAQPQIIGATLRELNVVIPDKLVQMRYLKLHREVTEMTKSRKEDLDRLDNLFTSLQHRAFNGEL